MALSRPGASCGVGDCRSAQAKRDAQRHRGHRPCATMPPMPLGEFDLIARYFTRPTRRALLGDALWVSQPPGGGLGDARLALEVFRDRVALDGSAFAAVRRAMEWPQPRVALGNALRGVARAAIDLSDGLSGDLGHILQRS